MTALIAAGGGFLATGTWGTGATQNVIVWWSPNGLAWHPVRPAGRGFGGAGGQQITGLSVSGGILPGVGSTATGMEQRPVLWQTRIR